MAKTKKAEGLKDESKSNAKELALIESRSLRDQAISSTNIDFLDKLKAIQYLTDDMIMGIEQIANYYDVSKNAVEIVIKRNRDEFESDGIKVLIGEELKQLKNIVNLTSSQDDGALIGSKVNSFMILTKRSLLRVGMIMTNSTMATKIRNYLLNLEEVATQEQKNWSLQREVGIIDRKRLTDAIQKYIPDSNNIKYNKYAQYTNLVYNGLFAKTAKEMKDIKGIKTNDLLRDSFSQEQLKDIDEAETIVTALVSLGFGYEQIKVSLVSKFNYKYKGEFMQW